MDVMDLRRGLLMAMAKGVDVIKGTIVPTSSNKTIYFGKTLNRYIAYFEMDKESKEMLASQWTSGSRSYGCICAYFAGCDSFDSYKTVFAQRYSGTTTPTSSSTQIGGLISEMNPDNLELEIGTVASGVYYFYEGFTYNYMIIPID